MRLEERVPDMLFLALSLQVEICFPVSTASVSHHLAFLVSHAGHLELFCCKYKS